MTRQGCARLEAVSVGRDAEANWGSIYPGTSTKTAPNKEDPAFILA